jgi:hypothetical protein
MLLPVGSSKWEWIPSLARSNRGDPGARGWCLPGGWRDALNPGAQNRTWGARCCCLQQTCPHAIIALREELRC